jgi:DNA-directed RNA polymerase specialized sigma24 family protein
MTAKTSLSTTVRFSGSILTVATAPSSYPKAKRYEWHCQRDVHNWEQSKSILARATPSNLQFFLSQLPIAERAVVQLVYANGCSRGETADVMKIGCDHVDVLLRAVRASAILYYGVTSEHSRGTY